MIRTKKQTTKHLYRLALACVISGSYFSCSNSNHFDASGSFEAVETIISAEASGVIEEFSVEEGTVLKAGEYIGYIDSTQLYLKKRQMESQVQALLTRKPDIAVQLASLEKQMQSALREKKRIENLVQAGAATTKQKDDILSQIDIIQAQIDAANSSLTISTDGITKDARPLYLQIEQLKDLLRKCRIVNPVNGTVLVKYAEPHEMTATGKQLYKIADLSKIILKAYITGNQLAQVKLNDTVTVFTDNGTDGFNKTDGRIQWISDKAEFTPKTIQTKDERANQVYAIKILVPNDGSLKIGMYGEVVFHEE